jgi:hypothetical protein
MYVGNSVQKSPKIAKVIILHFYSTPIFPTVSFLYHPVVYVRNHTNVNCLHCSYSYECYMFVLLRMFTVITVRNHTNGY